MITSFVGLLYSSLRTYGRGYMSVKYNGHLLCCRPTVGAVLAVKSYCVNFISSKVYSRFRLLYVFFIINLL